MVLAAGRFSPPMGGCSTSAIFRSTSAAPRREEAFPSTSSKIPSASGVACVLDATWPVVNGYGAVLVTAVGEETELGRIGRLVEEAKEASRPTLQLALMVDASSAVTTVLGLAKSPALADDRNGRDPGDRTAPEGLQAVTTSAPWQLALRRMARALLVRRLSS